MTAQLNAPGSYVLLLKVTDPVELEIGALGGLTLKRGWLLYVGSAFGSGGIAGRLKHHLRAVQRPRWHIDYVRQYASLTGVYFANGARNLEHQWAVNLKEYAESSAPMHGFGASDCECQTHLFFLSQQSATEKMITLLKGEQTTLPVGFFSSDQLHHLIQVNQKRLS